MVMMHGTLITTGAFGAALIALDEEGEG